MLNLSFILYPLFVLLSRYLCQLPFSHRSMGRDTDSVVVISITGVFRQVGHCGLRCRKSHIRYAGAGPLTVFFRSSAGDKDEAVV